MADNKEKNEEKNLPTQQENPQDTPDTEQTDSKSDSKSNAAQQDGQEDQTEHKIKSLEGQISKLQKELNQAKEVDVKEQLLDILGRDDQEEESDVDPLEEVKKIRAELDSAKAENTKNAYIDSLDVSEVRKKALKRRVKASMDEEELEQTVNTELELINEILESETPKASDMRPVGYGRSRADDTDLDTVLANPEQYNK